MVVEYPGRDGEAGLRSNVGDALQCAPSAARTAALRSYGTHLSELPSVHEQERAVRRAGVLRAAVELEAKRRVEALRDVKCDRGQEETDTGTPGW